MGLFNAITNHTYATFKDTVTGLTRRELTEPLTNYNVVVADKQWKNNSSVYFINTNVTRGGGFNDADVVGAGFNLMNKKNTYGAEGAFDYSMLFISDPSSQKSKKQITGYRYVLGISKSSGTIRWGISQVGLNPDYNATDLGYHKTVNRFFNADLLFNWRFAPGSTLSISYKNIFENAGNEILTYSKNFDTVFNNPHTHTLSLKVLYYLDYLQLRKNK